MKQILILLFLFTFSINAQEQTPRIKIGYNIVPLICKSTDLFIETNITTSVALLVNIGNTYAPVRGFYQKDDGVALEEMSGYFFKLGGKYAWLNKEKTDVWVGLSLIGSYYKESGTRSGIAVSSEGIVFGGAFITGMDIQLWHFLDLRMGCQIATYHRSDHIGSSDMTYQPGIGAIYGGIVAQPIFGLVVKIGRRTNK